MKENLKKCSLYIRVHNMPGIQYSVHPTATEIVDTARGCVYNFTLNVNSPPNIIIDIQQCNDSYIQVEKMEYNDVCIDNLNSICNTKTHGFFNTVGRHYIKLHTNPVSINFINYLLSLASNKHGT